MWWKVLLYKKWYTVFKKKIKNLGLYTRKWLLDTSPVTNPFKIIHLSNNAMHLIHSNNLVLDVLTILGNSRWISTANREHQTRLNLHVKDHYVRPDLGLRVWPQPHPTTFSAVEEPSISMTEGEAGQQHNQEHAYNFLWHLWDCSVNSSPWATAEWKLSGTLWLSGTHEFYGHSSKIHLQPLETSSSS